MSGKGLDSNNMEEPDFYELDDLIEKLEAIKEGKLTSMNIPRYFYSLALEIKSIKSHMEKTKSSK